MAATSGTRARENRRADGARSPGLRLFGADFHAGLRRRCFLELGPEPADETGAFFRGARGVAVDEAEEDLFVGQIGRPAIGFEDVLVVTVVADGGIRSRNLQ